MKSKKTKIIAFVLCAAVMFTMVGISAFARNNESKDPEESHTEVTDTSETAATFEGDTVYVLAGADGRIQKVISGDEESDKEVPELKSLPVKMSVQYTLDGKSISPEELAGKSGHVTMRFDYENMQWENVKIDGKTEKIYVPFTVMTGMLLDSEAFQNVEVSNGKLMDDGNHIAVAGLAFPGLQEDLNISREKLEIPDHVEVSADVKCFALDMTMTLVTTEPFDTMDGDKPDLSELSGAMGELENAMNQLLDGSSRLYDGLCTLMEKSGELVGGINQLEEGANSLDAGAKTLDEGAAGLKAGVDQLSAGLNTLDSNGGSLREGARQVFSSLISMANTKLSESGLSVPTLTIDNYAGVLDGVIASLDDNAVYQAALAEVTSKVNSQRDEIRKQVEAVIQKQVEEEILSQGGTEQGTEIEVLVKAKMESEEVQALIDSNTELQVEKAISEAMSSEEVQAKLSAAAEGAKSVIALKSSLDSYNAFYLGVIAYTSGVSEACAGAKELQSGADALKTGTAELSLGAAELHKGITTMKDSSPALVDGITKLKDGSMQLSEGLTQFNEEGIKKLTKALNGNVEGLTKRIRAMVSLAKNHSTFPGSAENGAGSIKFIYKTDSIE